MAKYKIVGLPKQTEEYFELDLTPEEIEEYARGGFIIEDISVPSLSHAQEGGEPKRKKHRFIKGTEEAKEFPADEWGQYIQEEPDVVVRPLTPEQQQERNSQRNMEFLQNIREGMARNNPLYLPDGTLRPQAAQAADWFWQLGMLGATGGLGKSAINAAEAAGSRALPYITGALETSIPGMASVPGATVGNALGAGFAGDAIVNRLYPSAGKIQEGKYGEAATDIATGLLDLYGANMLSPAYKGVKATASELGKFLGTEEGLLSNAYKVNPWAFKPDPTAGYRMIGGKEGYLDAIKSGEIRPTGAYDVAHFNIGQPLNPNRLSAEELIQAGSPGGYKGPYMAEMKDGTWQRMTDAFSNNPEMQEQFKLLGKDKDVWQHPLFGNIKVDDPRLKLYKEHWLKGYKEVPRELPGSPNSFSIFPRKPIPLSDRSLEFGKASKTVGGNQIPDNRWLPKPEPNPEYEWFNPENKKLYDEFTTSLEEQAKRSQELSDFDAAAAMDKINASKLGPGVFKNLIMGDDLLWKTEEYLGTPYIPYTRRDLLREGNKLYPRVQYKPMDPFTKEQINVLNNYERSTNMLNEAEQAILDIKALRTEMEPRDFVRQFRYELRDPKTSKPYTIEQIKRASPQQISSWRKQIERNLLNPIYTEIQLQGLLPKVKASDFKYYSNKEGGQISSSKNTKLSKFIS